MKGNEAETAPGAFRIAKLPGAGDLELPAYMTEGAAGMDLRANVTESVVIPPGGVAMISAGIVLALPRGYEAQVRPRSGLAYKHGVTVLNAPGTIDSDYRGEIKTLLINHGKESFTVNRGDRVAQLVICRYERVEWEQCGNIDDGETERGAGGYGHTG